MKHHIVRTVCFATLLLSLAAAALAQGRRPCSPFSLEGTWGYNETGQVLVVPTGAIVPVGVVGIYDFDAWGRVVGRQFPGQDTKRGTFTIDPDCVGTMTLTAFDPSGNPTRTSTWAFVLVDQAQEMRAAITSMVITNGPPVSPVITMTAKRQFPGRGSDQPDEQ